MNTLIRILAISIVLQIAPAQSKKEPAKYVEICRLNRANGKYLATILGRSIGDNLFSDIVVVRRTKGVSDTLFRLSKRDLCYEGGWGGGVGKCYDGFGIERFEIEGFTYWMEKRNVTASDGQLVKWNHKKNRFERIFLDVPN